MERSENTIEGSVVATPRYQPLVLVFTALCAGAAVDRYGDVSFGICLATALFGLVVWVATWRQSRPAAGTLCLLVAAAGVGGAWHHARWSHYDVAELSYVATASSQPVIVEATAIDSPRWLPAPVDDPLSSRTSNDRTRVRVRITRVRSSEDWEEASGRASLTVTGTIQDIDVGDRLRIVAFLRKPQPPMNPGEFDFASYLRRQRELCSLTATSIDCVEVVERGSEWQPSRWLAKLRRAGTQQLAEYTHPNQAALAAAILLGARERLDADRTERFFTSGTIHLLAISGLHIGILAGGLFLIMRLMRVSHGNTLLFVGTFVIIYALVTDARPPIVRASILIVILCFSRVFRRRALGFNTLAAAAMIVFALHPAHFFQVGTQLSFLAVATLIAIAPWLQWHLPDDPLDRLIALTRPFHIRLARRFLWSVWRLWLASFVIWIVALPLVMYHFHLVSPIGLLLNPIVWLPISLALFAGFGVLVFGFALPPLANLCGCVCSQSLALIEQCLTLSSHVPVNHFWTAGPSLWWTIGSYVLLGILATCPRLRPSRPWFIALVAAWLTCGYLSSPAAINSRDDTLHPKLTCTFIAIGHGTAVLIELPDGRNVLYDAGHLGSPTLGARTITSVLWSCGITHLDAIVLSHADIDHYNAVPELLKRFSVGTVIVSPVMFATESEALNALHTSITANDILLREISAGKTLRVGGSTLLEVLHPPVNPVGEDDNANSIVLLIEFAGRRILLPGDIEGIGLLDLLSSPPIDTDITMAPHHGSANSRPDDFQAWSMPELMVISCGPGRDRTTIAIDEVQAAQTSEQGAIRCYLHDDGTIASSHWSANGWRPLEQRTARELD